MSGAPLSPPHAQRSMSVTRDTMAGATAASPLKIFNQAKEKVKKIFTDISEFISETDHFLQSASKTDGVVTDHHKNAVDKFSQRSKGIAEVLARDHMKCVFFGRTSNGKSTVMNSMLGTKLLPTGIGHTTHCFLQVEGSSESSAYILTEGSNEWKGVQSLKQLASALSTLKVSSNSLIKIYWPQNKCRLLKEGVVLLDSPGIGVDDDLDSWIDKFCLDADVFVLVSNAESTLMQTEKNFFHKVSERLSQPNIFILHNRWDASAMEPEDMEDVKTQHLERAIKFLADELRVCSRHEAEERVFFVSAREALIQRQHQESGTPTPTGALMDGFQVRMFEFCNFERKFEECISMSAVKTKFAKHADRGLHIVSGLRQVMDDIYNTTRQKRTACETRYQDQLDRLDYTEKQLALLSTEIKEKMKQMVDNVEKKVSAAMKDEIRRLSALVDEFDRPFHPDPSIVSLYKKELHVHVEEGVGRNLQSRCSSALSQAVENAEKEMTQRLSSLLPEGSESRHQILNLSAGREFQIAYRLDCRNLCGDFREDVEFRFSLGITTLVQRFLGPKSHAALRGLSESVPRPVSRPQTSDQDDVMAMAVTTFASLTSRSTMGTVIVAGLVLKSAGWRILAVCGSIYGLLYMYERLTWTKKAQERAFKRQYVDFVGDKLRLIVDLTSANCSRQVEQQLSSVFSQLKSYVEQAKDEMRSDIRSLEKECEGLQRSTNDAKLLKNKADWLTTELESFSEEYLIAQQVAPAAGDHSSLT